MYPRAGAQEGHWDGCNAALKKPSSTIVYEIKIQLYTTREMKSVVCFKVERYARMKFTCFATVLGSQQQPDGSLPISLSTQDIGSVRVIGSFSVRN